MKQQLIFLLLFSICGQAAVFAQNTNTADSVDVREKYGLRLGIDLVKPVRTLIEEDYQGFEIKGDYRLYENIYLAGELGYDKNTLMETNVTANAKGSYIKLGANYNFYENWAGMQNLIYFGVRYGFANFSTELEEYTIYTGNPYFEPDIRTEPREFSNLTASWAELQLGLKVEVLNNVYLGAHLQLKKRITQTQPTNFDNLYIPGFNRTYDDGSIGVGYGYSISYLIPLFKK